MRVLIVKTSALGDIVNALPVLDYLHQTVPGIEVDWVVEESFRELLEGNPLLSVLHPVRAKAWRQRPFSVRTLREIVALKDALVGRHYDYAFDLEGTLGSGVIIQFAGARDRIGLQRGDLKDSSNLLFSMRRVPLRRQDCHVCQKCLRLVSVPFARDYAAMELCCTIATHAEDDLAAEALLATLSDGVVLLFEMNGDCQTKLWSEQSWVELGKRVLELFPEATILLSWGSESEKTQAVGIGKSIGGARLIDRHTLKGLVALLKRIDLVVGADTDTIQLAAALGTPTVSFYRASDGRQSGPRGEHHVVLQSPIHCTRCFRVHCDQDLKCRGTIKVEALLAGIASLLGTQK